LRAPANARRSDPSAVAHAAAETVGR